MGAIYGVSMNPAIPRAPRLWHSPSRAFWFLLGVYVILALAYNFYLPPFEPSDEIYHFRYVRFLIEQRRLPVSEPGQLSLYHHPPLYYALSAILTWPWPAQNWEDYQVNPYHGFRYWEPGVDNKNLYVHGPWDGWPFHNIALAVHIARLVSLALGAATLWLTYQAALIWEDEAVALTATGLMAFLPMFLTVTGSVQNDAGAMAGGALLTWLGAYFYQTGLNVRRALILGSVVGVTALMKISGLLLFVPAVALIGLSDQTPRPTFWRSVTLLSMIGCGVVGVAGWWYARNWFLYGDLTAMSANLGNFGGQTVAMGVQNWSANWAYAWTTFWGRFGHGEVVLAETLYNRLGFITLLALAGLVYALITLPHPMRLWPAFLGVIGLSELAGLLYYLTISPTGANARYTFPALPAYMILMALGLLTLAPTRWRVALARLLVTLQFIFGVEALVGYIIPAYYPPAPLSQLPPTAQPLDARLGDLARLKGYAVTSALVRPGEMVELTLYWLPLDRSGVPYSVYIHLLDPNQVLIAQRDSYPGLGRNPTTAWAPGQLFADQYRVYLPPDLTVPVTAHWEVGLWDAATEDRVFLLDATEQPVAAGVTFGELLIRLGP